MIYKGASVVEEDLGRNPAKSAGTLPPCLRTNRPAAPGPKPEHGADANSPASPRTGGPAQAPPRSRPSCRRNRSTSDGRGASQSAPSPVSAPSTRAASAEPATPRFEARSRSHARSPAPDAERPHSRHGGKNAPEANRPGRRAPSDVEAGRRRSRRQIEDSAGPCCARSRIPSTDVSLPSQAHAAAPSRRSHRVKASRLPEQRHSEREASQHSGTFVPPSLNRQGGQFTSSPDTRIAHCKAMAFQEIA